MLTAIIIIIYVVIGFVLGRVAYRWSMDDMDDFTSAAMAAFAVLLFWPIGIPIVLLAVGNKSDRQKMEEQREQLYQREQKIRSLERELGIHGNKHLY